MRIGTKSVLFGAHTFWMHPWFLALAWWQLYGWSMVTCPTGLRTCLWDPRLWLCFFIHDLGYIGKPNMDGEEGELHPLLAGNIMLLLFGRQWQDFVVYHSRFLARKDGKPYSLLCIADKLAISLTPAWIYLPLVRRTGEIHEYRKLAEGDRYPEQRADSEEKWYQQVRDYCWKYAWEHRDGREDTWTPNVRQAQTPEGTWS